MEPMTVEIMTMSLIKHAQVDIYFFIHNIFTHQHLQGFRKALISSNYEFIEAKVVVNSENWTLI